MHFTLAPAHDATTPLVACENDLDALKLGTEVTGHLRARLKRGAVATLPVGKRVVVALRVSDWSKPFGVRTAGGQAGRALAAEHAASARVLLPVGCTAAQARLLLLGLAQGAYQWTHYLSKQPTALTSVQVGMAGRGTLPLGASDLRVLGAQATAVRDCRDMINLAAEDMGPAEFERAARRAVRGTGLRLRVLDERACTKLGMGCLLAVGRASPRRARMLVVEWPGRGARKGFVALCGKGICFDTGGLDIKPASAMELMRKDMGGAATVLAAMRVLALAKPRQRVRAYLPLADNAIDGSAFRPGDVLRAIDGTTIEIGNTDAEGRLVLADAIGLAKREGATAVVTVATLTGAALIALGRVRVPLMGSDDALLRRIESAAEAQGEKVWRMPFDEEYHQMVRGPIADLSNSPPGGDAGCITAGAFLAHFAKGLSFAHLDISPASWQTKPHALGGAGATGVMVDTLVAAVAS